MVAVIMLASTMAWSFINLLDAQRASLLEATADADRARREAQRANEAKTEFLTTMSHELRTPLNTVIGAAEVLARETAERHTAAYAREISQAGEALVSTINEILDIAKIEQGRSELHLSRYELGSLIGDSLNLVALRLRNKGLQAQVTCDRGLPRLLVGDEFHLRQVLVNLLTNAVKYTDHGTVELAVAGEEADGRFWLTVAVKDTGRGIRPEDQAKLFEKYVRFDADKNRSVEGTGLGLPIAKSLVELMGGSIAVESVYGVGSTFTVRVPQEVADRTPLGDVRSFCLGAGADDEAEAARRTLRAPGASVLVVDDTMANRRVIVELLKPTQLKVDTAGSGSEALRRACERTYDLVLMDHMMPGMDGIETMRSLRSLERSLNRETPVVMLAAAVPGINVREGLSFCADDPDFYRSMLLDFAQSPRRDELGRHFSNEDWDDYRIDVHSLKSSTKMLGLDGLSEESRLLERAAREGDVAYVKSHHGPFADHCDQVSTALRKLL